MWREGVFCRRLVLPVSVLPVPGPVPALLSPGQVSTILSPHVRVRCTQVALAWLPISQQIISKGMEVSRCGHRVRVCVKSAVLWTDSELGVALVDEQRTLPTFHGCTQTLFQNQRLWTGSLRGEALTCAGGQLPTESDSLAQGRTRTPDTRPRCDLANRRLERERKARDLVLVTPRVRNCDFSCRRVSHALREGKRRAIEAQVT